jgi:hypothetical protein
MTSVKSVFGVGAALLPVAYCGGLLYYFTQNNTLSGPVGQGLGPTVLGLGAVGLLFCAPVIFKLLKLFAPAKPEAGKGREVADEEPVSSFDADAALARYMARKAAQGDGQPPRFEPSAPRGGFGRKAV